MRKLMFVCIVVATILFVTIGTYVELEASTPLYEQPRFSSIEEFIEWVETVDATNFQSGRFESSLQYWRNRGEVFIPYFSNPDITIARVAVIPMYVSGTVERMMIHFVHSTPVGLSQITVRMTNIDPRYIATYEARGIGAYYTASRRGEFEVAYVSEKTITARDSQTGGIVERSISYAFIDGLDASNPFAFTMFIMDGFELGLTYRNPLVAEYFGDLVWDRAPITYRPIQPPRPPVLQTIRLAIGSTVYTIDDAPHESDVAPFIDPAYDRAMIPLRVVSEALGANVDWIPTTRTVWIDMPGASYQLIIDTPLPGGMGVPVLYQDRVFVPVRYVAEILGATPRWDGSNAAVYIYHYVVPS